MRAVVFLAALAVTLSLVACGPTPFSPLLPTEAERQAEATRELHQGLRSLSLGDRDAADRHFLQAAFLYGAENQGFVRVAQRLQSEGECDRAGLLLEQASALPEYRSNPFVFHTLAQTSRNKGDSQQAETLEKRATALVADAEAPRPTPSESERQARVHQLVLCGRYAVEVQHRVGKGVALLRQAVALRGLTRASVDNVALSALGYALAENPSHAFTSEEALQITRQAAQAELDNAALRHAYGWALFCSGDTEGALRVLREAADLDQCDPQIHHHLGQVYHTRGALAQAAQELDCALRLSPHDPELERARQQLQGQGPSRANHAQ